MNFAFTLSNTETFTLDEYIWNVAVLAHLLNPVGIYNDYFLIGYPYCYPSSSIPIDASAPTQSAQSTQSPQPLVKTVKSVQSTTSSKSPIDGITGWVPGTADPTPDVALTDLGSL